MVIIDRCPLNFDFDVNYTGKLLYKNFHMFCFKGEIHRFYGPAKLFFTSKSKEWWFNNQFYGANNDIEYYNQQKFIKKLDKIWLL